MRRSYKLKLWWLGLDSIDRLSVAASVFVFSFVLFTLLVLLEII
jgi:hypothetical protein